MRKLLYSFTLALFYLLFPISSWAANYCVSTTGSDTNDGIDDSTPACWLTIQRANTTVVAGDSIKVNSGVYAITSTIDTTKSGTSASARIRYYSATQYGAIIRPTSAISTAVWNNHGNWVDIDGFDFDGVNDGDRIRIGVLNDGTNVRVLNNVIHNFGSANAPDVVTFGGAAVSNTGVNLTVSGNHFFDIGLTEPPASPGVHGIYDTGTGGGIHTNNHIHNISAHCILIYTGYVTPALISGNKIHNCNRGIFLLIGNGHNVFNNVLYNNQVGIQVETDNNFIRSNTLGGTVNDDIQLALLADTGNQVQNNLVFPGQIVVTTPGTNTVTFNLTGVDPNFIDAPNGDFRIPEGSKAKDTGATLGPPWHVDIDNKSRPFGAGYDIGAYEFGSGGRFTFYSDVDFDGDGRNDIGVYRDGTWFILRSSDGGVTVTAWGGLPQDVPVPGDYDGDGKTDVAVYRDAGQSATQALWLIKRSFDGGTSVLQWGGLPEDIPVPGDYDGDGKTDMAVYRDGTWFILRSFDGGVMAVPWGGLPQDVPVPADYDGDRRTDVAIYRDGTWFILLSSGGVLGTGWGGWSQDVPVPADYDGDNKTDLAVYRDGTWFILRSSDNGVTTTGWGGLLEDIPVPGDYDGDGKTDMAVYRDGTWFIRRSFDGGVAVTDWGGLPQDIPLNRRSD